MSRRLRIEVQLPDLAPAQADLLWNLFDEIAQQIWEAYETELFDFASELYCSRPPDPSHEDAAAPVVAPSVVPERADHDVPDSDL